MGILYNDWLDNNLLRLHYSKIPYDIVAENILRLIKINLRNKKDINVLDFAFDLSADKNDHINGLDITIISNFEEHYGHFDFIWVNQVLEHLSDPLGVLLNLYQCLTNTGIIYAGVPDCKNIKQIIAHEKTHVSQYHSFDIIIKKIKS